MAKPSRMIVFSLIVGLSTSGGLLWIIAAEKESKDKKLPSNVKLTATKTLGGEDRFLTHVSTDKPIYRPGERLYTRAVVLHHVTHNPLPNDRQSSPLVEIKGPKGDTVASGYKQLEESVAGFSWDIPKTQAGGEYTLRISHPGMGYAPTERKFDIRAYRAPRLKSQIKFLRDGYGPGDQAVATLHVERAEGGVPTGAKVTVTARVDGEEAFRGKTTIDDEGNCIAQFQLPEDIRRGEGTLAMIIEDGGIVETASKTIPILLQTVDLSIYPEGGDLVAGLSSRVYFEAFTPAKKPADLKGVVVDDRGRKVAEFQSEHEGRGRFEFTPKANRKYSLKITEPSGIETQYPLPVVKSEGAVLSSHADVFASKEPILLKAGVMPVGREFLVTLSKREKVIATARPEFSMTKFQLSDDDPDGVLVATVWGKDGKPLAERLIYRRPSKSIKLKIKADAKQYTPGGKAKLTVEATDEAGEPISAVVGVSVTDDSVLEMIEKREQAPRLPVMVLLENDVRELADSHVYLDPKNEKAPLAVDLLLGTQGWRRFAFVESGKFIEQHGDAARRALALQMQTIVEASKALNGRGGVRRFFRFREDDGALVPNADIPQAANAVPIDAVAKGKKPQLNAAAGKPDAAAKIPAQANAEAELRQPALEALKQREANGDRKKLAQSLDKAERQNALRKIVADEEIAVRNDFVAVRIYAHKVRSNRVQGERTDFTETLYWHAGIKTDEQGKATVEFGLNDSVTSFRVFADAFADGALGSHSLQIDSVEPFYLEPKFPIEVTAGDHIRLPIGIVNSTAGELDETRVALKAHSSFNISSQLAPFTLRADERIRQLIEISVGQHNGQAELTLNANAGPYADKVTRTLTVKPQGFPIEFGRGGLIGPGDTLSHEFTVPDNLVRASLEGRVVVYPTPLASMTEALEGLIRQPSGCFEQTSSTVYPLVMAQQYFMSHQGVDPSLVERSSQILTTGYERLLGFECKSGGFEWFGSDPGHDA